MLDVFSGRPNPVWRLDNDLLGQVEMAIDGVGFSEPPDGLGYRGVKIVESDTVLDEFFTTADALGQFTEVATISGNADLERTLLESARSAGAIDEDLFGFISDRVSALSETSSGAEAISPNCPPCGGADAPSYDPAYWNDPARQPLNNCYNYANNQATNTFAQPGRGSGTIFPTLDCDGVRGAAERDGLVTTDTFQASRAGWYVALVIWPGQDYHWYRQDDVGCWSHKPGRTRARNVDNSGNEITDPKTCDRGPYSIFCTYMVTNTGVTIS
jgi:hypothetical protein